MRRPVLIVGEHNPLSTNPRYALFDLPVNCAGHRLRTRVLALSRKTYLGPLIQRTNLCIGPYNHEIASQVAADIIRSQRRGNAFSAIVMLGSKVWRAFDAQVDVFRHTTAGRVTLVALPHPSGRSREWNEPMAAHVARCLLRDLVPHVPWGEEQQ